MKVTVKQILEGQQSIAKLLDKSLPAATAFRLGRLVSKVDAELKVFDDQRTKLVQEMGEDIGEGKFKIKDENIDKFNAEMNTLMAIEIDIDVQQLSISEFGAIEVTARDLLQIEWLVKE
jgi:hypothetical protein